MTIVYDLRRMKNNVIFYFFQILGIYAFVATGLGLGGAYAIRNGFKRMDEERHIFNVDDPDFWIEYFRLFSTF